MIGNEGGTRGDSGAAPEALGALPREAEPTHDLWPEIAGRLGQQQMVGATGAAQGGPDAGIRRSGWLRAAAAIVLFGAGSASGFALGSRDGARPDGSLDEALALAAEVQRTGSEYIAALAAFTAVMDSLSSDARGQGTDAALATLYGAANQLAILSAWRPHDPPAAGDAAPVRF